MFRANPKIDIRPNRTDWKFILAGWSFIALSFVLTCCFYPSLPDRIPIHFDLKGVANGFGHKSTLWFLHLINGTTLLGLTLLATKMRPWNFNYPVKISKNNAAPVYTLGIRMLATMSLLLGAIIAFIPMLILHLIFTGSRLGIGLIAVLTVALLVQIVYFYLKMINIPK